MTFADTREVEQAIDPEMLGGDVVLSGLIAACQTLKPPQSSRVAWSLWQHSLALGHSLSNAAADVLWHTQSGHAQTHTKSHHLRFTFMYMLLTHTVNSVIFACLQFASHSCTCSWLTPCNGSPQGRQALVRTTASFTPSQHTFIIACLHAVLANLRPCLATDQSTTLCPCDQQRA